MNDQLYSRIGCGPVNYYYEAVEINVIETGYYIIVSDTTIDIYGSIYDNYFNVFSFRTNLILEDKNNGCNDQFKILIRLQANTTYILVVTTFYPNVTGTFSILIFGSNNVSMHHISEYCM